MLRNNLTILKILKAPDLSLIPHRFHCFHHFRHFHHFRQIHPKNEPNVPSKSAENFTTPTRQCINMCDPNMQALPKTTGQLVHFAKNCCLRRKASETTFHNANPTSFTRFLIRNWWFAPNAKRAPCRSSTWILCTKNSSRDLGWFVQRVKLTSPMRIC